MTASWTSYDLSSMTRDTSDHVLLHEIKLMCTIPNSISFSPSLMTGASHLALSSSIHNLGNVRWTSQKRQVPMWSANTEHTPTISNITRLVCHSWVVALIKWRFCTLINLDIKTPLRMSRYDVPWWVANSNAGEKLQFLRSSWKIVWRFTAHTVLAYPNTTSCEMLFEGVILWSPIVGSIIFEAIHNGAREDTYRTANSNFLTLVFGMVSVYVATLSASGPAALTYISNSLFLARTILRVLTLRTDFHASDSPTAAQARSPSSMSLLFYGSNRNHWNHRRCQEASTLITDRGDFSLYVSEYCYFDTDITIRETGMSYLCFWTLFTPEDNSVAESKG